MKIDFVATGKLSEIQKESLKQLRAAVYPPEVRGNIARQGFYMGSTAMVRFRMGSG